MTEKPLQINITRRGKDRFHVTTFDKKECRFSEEMDAEAVREFVSKTMKCLGLLPPA